MDMFEVVIYGVGVDADIINELDHKPFFDAVAQDVCDETLEGRWGVAQPKRHDVPFKLPILGDESGLASI